MAETREQKLARIEEKLAGIRARKATAEKGVEELRKRKEAGEVITPKTELLTISAKELREGISAPDLGAFPPADTKGVDTAYTNATSTSQLLAQQIAQQQKEREELEKSLTEAGATGEGFWQKMLSLVGKKPTADVQAQLATAQEKYEVPEWLSKVQAQNVKVAQIQGDITKLEVQRQTEIDRAYTAGMSMSYIRSNINEIDRVHNSKRAYKVAEMSAEAALMQAYQGNLDSARDLVSDAVSAYTYDIQQERADFDTLFNVYGDWINSLETKDREILENTREDLEKQEAQVREDKTNIMNLMLEYPKAGISIADTLEDATEKARSWTAEYPEEEILTPSEAATLGVPYGTTREKAAEMGITPPRWKPTEAGVEDKEYWKNLVRYANYPLSGVPQDIRAVIGEELRLEGELPGVPHEWTDEEIRQTVYAYASQGYEPTQVRLAFMADANILNRDRALMILDELKDIFE